MQILEAVICLHNLHNSSYYTQHNKRTSDNKHNNKEAITWVLVKYFSLVEKPVVGKESVTGFLLKSFFVVVVVFFQVHFRGNERILFDYKLSQMFLGDMCKLKILRQGEVMTVEVKLDLVTSLVPTQLYDKRPR